MNTRSACTVLYEGDEIVLVGAAAAIHLEAKKILRRFAHSSRPYELKSDGTQRVVLRASHEAMTTFRRTN
jgi:hypothetical protein